MSGLRSAYFSTAEVKLNRTSLHNIKFYDDVISQESFYIELYTTHQKAIQPIYYDLHTNVMTIIKVILYFHNYLGEQGLLVPPFTH